MKIVVWNHYGFYNLLFWLFVYIVLDPFLAPLPYTRYLAEFLLSSVLFFAIFAVRRERKVFSIALFLLILTLLFHWTEILGIVHFSQPFNFFVMVIYLGTLVYSFALGIVTASHVTLRLLAATLCLYLIIALLWGSIFALLESLVPGSFGGGMLEQAKTPDQLLQCLTYFSFVTMTTLGYGDITPQTMGAGGLCQAEAIIGQFYTAVLVAYLVGMYSSQSKIKKHSD